MSAVDNLEKLDNKALREKCIEFSLPNVPVTDTSRKLLIKRLRTAMSGGDGTKATDQKKSRREVIHGIKVDNETNKKKELAKTTPTKAGPVCSRRTIGAPIVREAVLAPACATVTQRRRSNRITRISDLEPVTAFTSTRNFRDLIEESDEDCTPITINIPVTVEKSSELVRQTKTPLSKSLVVATSYATGTPERSPRDKDEPVGKYDGFEDDFEPEVQIMPIKNKYISSKGSYDSTKLFGSLGKKDQFSSLETKEQFSSFGNKEPSFGLETSRFESTTSRMSLSNAPTSIFSLDSTPIHRYTTGGYQAATTSSENTAFAHRTDYKGNSEGESLEPQYQSDFARRLSRLKAKPLSSRLRPEVDSQRTASRYYSGSVTCRRSIK